MRIFLLLLEEIKEEIKMILDPWKKILNANL